MIKGHVFEHYFLMMSDGPSFDQKFARASLGTLKMGQRGLDIRTPRRKLGHSLLQREGGAKHSPSSLDHMTKKKQLSEIRRPKSVCLELLLFEIKDFFRP